MEVDYFIKEDNLIIEYIPFNRIYCEDRLSC